MRIIKSFFIAFSMYSKIPMPQFAWKDEDMRYALCFFPWVGAVIGVLWYLWKWICARFGVGTLCYTVVGTAIPILITGGFHVDGFLDTCDALHSYRPRERKLEILKLLFPFCIPFDFIHLIQALKAEPETPKFEIPVKLDFVDVDTSIVIDLAWMDPIMKIWRLGELGLFIVMLMKSTSKVIRW